MKMTIEDYITKQRDITYLKLSREIQEYLGAVDYDGKRQREVAILEQTVAYQARQHERVLEQRAQQLRGLRKEATKTGNANDRLNDMLLDTNVALYERKNVAHDMSIYF
jgi:hypothetical protein